MKHVDGIFFSLFLFSFSLSNLHRYCREVREAALQSEPAGFFQINQEDKRRAGVEMGNATQQLGANWRSVHYPLLLGKLGGEWKALIWLVGPQAQCSVVRGGQHYGGARVSTEIWKLPIKGGTCGWLGELARGGRSTTSTQHIWTRFMNPGGQTFDKNKVIIYIERERYIHTCITKTLLLTLKLNDSINIQLQNVNVQVTKTDTETETLIQS